MATTTDHADELIDYEEDEETLQQQPLANQQNSNKEGGVKEEKNNLNGDQPADKKGSYVGVESSGFKDFLLKRELVRAVADCGFEHPSEVQQQCIPQSLLGVDVICQAKSGMGKTAVFVLATLHQIDPIPGDVGVIVLCHTRELAYQIRNEYTRFSKFLPKLKVAVFYGGTDVKKDVDLLKDKDRCPHIVVGTPGRILALVKDRALRLSAIKHFVLDECDKMLDTLDMRHDVQEIFRATPHNKQVMMFSATLNKDVRNICKRFMQNPLEIYVDDETKLTLHGLTQYYVKILETQKNRKLSDMLDALEFNQVCVFVKSTSRANELNKVLNRSNFPSICIHGHMPQEDRIERYKLFKSFDKRIMVCTDLFGRGIDVERVNIVINYDMPESADSYLHRVGRAGRFGTKGMAITFVSNKEDSETLNKVQERFEVDIKEFPEDISLIKDNGQHMKA